MAARKNKIILKKGARSYGTGMCQFTQCPNEQNNATERCCPAKEAKPCRRVRYTIIGCPCRIGSPYS